jgi:hypothetical protein
MNVGETLLFHSYPHRVNQYTAPPVLVKKEKSRDKDLN